MSTTPILDLEQLPPEPPKPWVSWLTGGLIGLFIVFVPSGFVHFPDFNGFLLLPALYVAVAVHEFGHLVAGRFTGMESGGVRIGGFAMFRSGDHWVFRFDYRTLLGGGMAKSLPPKGEFRLTQYAWMVAGGPIASIALAAACGLAIVSYGSGSGGWVICQFWAALLTVFSLIPARVGLNRSDGARLWMLMRHPEQSRSWMALLMLQAEETRGAQPAEWDSQLFAEMLAIDPTSSEYPYCQLLAYYRRIDEGDELASLEHLENALSKSARSGKAVRHFIFMEAAFSSAIRRSNAAQARTWLKRACTLRKPETTDSVEAAIAICEKRYDDASTHFDAARSRIGRRRLDSGLIRFAKKKWTEYEKQYSAPVGARTEDETNGFQDA